MIPAQPYPPASDFAAHLTGEPPSAYYQRLHPWCIIRQLPKMQRLVVNRFRQRSLAEDHLKTLRRLTPDANYLLLFDP